ncbi:MAG: aminobenzoate synthetase, partial [Rhodospirillaceae bacterium BRH_c57]
TATAPWTAEQDPADAEARIRAAIAFILAGDIFQANVTQRFLATLPTGLDAFTLYRRLRTLSPAPFAACASFGGAHLLSASPERFLRIEPGGRVETRPIKGTRPRGATPAEDAALAAELLASDKDRAENLMIVDLMRNDLARVCRVGSVAVPVLNGLETFASVHHLVSVVEGVLEDGRGPVDLLRAAFPGGSITGAPKIRAMEIINGLEPARRGLYCGTLFRLGGDGAFDSSILIRSLVVGRMGRVAAQAGGGITADSDPAAEVAEAKVKAAPLLAALAGR